LEGVEVILQVDSSVYAGVTALKSQRLLTNNNGTFIFMYLTGNVSTKYSLTIRKEGFEPQTVLGSSPPATHHAIRLKKANSPHRLTVEKAPPHKSPTEWRAGVESTPQVRCAG
jgi:hypothetical protein